MLTQFFSLSPHSSKQIVGVYDLKLVALSFLMAVLASYITIDIIIHMRYQKNWKQFLWLCGGAFTMGAGIWSMHFIGMLSLSITNIELSYELYWTLLSLGIAILVSAIALTPLLNKVISSYQLVFSGMLLGVASAGMHYTGLEGVRGGVNFQYHPLLFVFSILFASIASITALWLVLKNSDVRPRKHFKTKLISAVILGTAICGMHYTGMAATVLTPRTDMTVLNPLNHTLLSVTIAALTLLFLIIVFSFSKQATTLQKLQETLEKEKHSLDEILSAKLKFALDTARFGSWDLNLVTNRLQRTLIHDQIYGFPTLQTEWSPQMFFKLIHPDDVEMMKKKTKEAIVNNAIIDVKFRIYRADDHSLRWLWARGKCVNIKKIPHLIGLTQDITDTTLASEKLRMSEERLRILLNSTREYAIYMINPDGIMTYWNQAAENVLGYKENEIIGQNIAILFSAEDREKHHPEYIRKIAREVGHYEEKNWRLRKDGKRFYANVVYTPVITDNHLVGFCIITRDLTQVELTEKKLRTVAELRRSNKDLEEFAYIASHDLKAPLRAIKNLSGWIQKDDATTLSAASKENFTLLTERIKRMENLIEGILQYSRAGLVDKESSTFALNDLLHEIVASLNPPKLFTFSYPITSIVMHTSKIQLQQVLCNLIDNAIKYHDKENGRITIGVKDHEKFYEISVSDNGPGIEKEYHHKIFQLFQTLQSKDVIESSGIGLAIVKKIVEMQGGEVTVVSSIKTGTTFSFTWLKQPQETTSHPSDELEEQFERTE